MDVGLAWRAETELTPAARAFREFLNLACAGQG